MKRTAVLVVLLAILVQPGSASTQAVPSQKLVVGAVARGVTDEPASTLSQAPALQHGFEPDIGGMPPRPLPAKPIPQHDAGKPSNAGNYVTEVTRLNDEGMRETVQISGLEAMVADGLDPLAGNHTLVNWDKLLFSAYQNQNSFDLRTLGFYTPTLQAEPESYLPLGNYQASDVAAGDLNGDGQAEQIAAWIGGGNHLYLSIGEMPGSQVATSAPAVVARGTGSPSGYALAFDGVDDYVEVGPGIDLASDSFTVAFWARRDSIDAAHMVVAQGWNAQNMALHIGFRANNAFTCAFQSNDLDTPAYTDTGWHYWACTYDAGSSTRRIYRDGVMVAQDTGVAAYGGSGVLNIGRLGIWDTNPFDGLIDEVGIWDVARTQEQIEADLSRTAPDETGLLAYWPFDEGSGLEAADISGNGHTGTLNGPAWNLENAPLADLHLVVRGYDEALWHCSYDVDSGDCLGWSNAAGGILASAPAIVSRGPDQFDLFALGVDNLVYQRHWDLEGWSADWVPEPPDPAQILASSMPTGTLPMPGWSAPAAVARGGDQIDLFRLAPDNTLRWRHSDDGATWGSWQNLGGMLASGPGAVSLGAGQMQVFARGADDALWTRTYGGDWGPWSRVPLDGMDAGVTIASAPSPVSPAAGEIVVYVRGSDGQLWSVTYAGSSWGTWSAGGGALASGVGAALWDGDDHLFSLSDDGRLQHSDDDGETWTPLRRLEAQLIYDTGSVAAAPYDPAALENFDVDVETGRFLGNGRDQIVVAHRDTDWNTYKIQLYDIGSGFEPVLVAEGSVTTSSYGYFSAARIATGDLNGDGLDEIAVIKLLTDARWWRIEVYDANSETGTIEFVAGTDGKYGQADFAGTMNIAAGDFDGDGLDEIAASSDWCDRSEDENAYYYDYHVNFTIVDDYSENLAVKYFQDLHLGAPDASTELSTYATGLALAAGDVDGDGKDEIVRTMAYDNDYFHSHIWPNLYRYLEVLDAGDLTDPQVGASVHLGAYSWESWLERLAVGDLDRDLVDEIAFFKVAGDVGHTEGTLQVHVYEYLPPTAPEDPGSLLLIDSAYPDPISFDWLRSPNLVAADYTGDGLRVGPPSYRVQTQMTTPEVFLNLPPMHRDILSGHGEITIGDGAKATHYAAHSQENKSTTQSNRDWSLSTGLETSVGGGGHTVSASLENTYGESFSKTETDISSIKFEDTTTARYYDQVIYNGTNYAIWEYPVLGIPADGEDGAPTISVIFPLVETTSQPVTQHGRLCDENFYAPSHQTYNVWSYDPLGIAEDFDDYDLLLSSKQTTGDTDYSMSMSDITQEALSDSFHNQISAGVEYSYKGELNVPLIGKAWDFSFRAYAKGSYGVGKISTLSTSFTEESAVDLDIPGMIDPSYYKIKMYLYWAKAGYLVVDYQTEPEDIATWSLYDKPDPAFILPWYGFPDPVTGLFPSPPDPDAPPCGLDRQLFTHDIDLDPAYVENGETVTLRATVRNFSDVVPTGTVTVRFYRGDPAAGSIIGSCTIAGSNLDRDLGPQTCSTTWVVSDGAGEERVYAVIDPLNAFDEMHDGDDVIDNNVGYGLLYVANADYFDPGLRQVQAYQAILFEDAPGLGFGLYLPTTNISETVRYELVPTLMGELSIVGKPVEVLAFRGGENEPESGHTFSPTPAGMMAWYRNGDLPPGMDEADLNLFRLDGAIWVPAVCPGYEVLRFPEDNRIAVPICETGVFVLSDGDLTQEVFLPLVLR